MKQSQPLVIQGPKTPSNPSGRQYLDINEVVGMPLAQFYEFAGNIVNVDNACYYDSAVVIAGTALTQAQKKALFTKGKSEPDTTMNTAAAIAEKGEFLTNMITGGEFEGGTTFLLESIAVDLNLTSEVATTYGSRGQIVAPNYTASTTVSAANNHKAYTEQIELQFLRNEDIKHRGLLRFFPSPFGSSGTFGSPNAGFIQNGFGVPTWNQMARVRVLQSEDRFSSVLNPIVETWTPSMTAVIRVCLLGKVIKAMTI